MFYHSFRSGNYCTKFIAEEYPNGFKRVELTPFEQKQMIATAVSVHLVENPTLLTRLSEEELNVLQASRGMDEQERAEHEERQYSRLVAVLDGPKGQAYEVKVAVGEEFRAVITPLDAQQRPLSAQAVEVTLDDLNWAPGEVRGSVHARDEKGESEAIPLQYLHRTSEGCVMRFRGCEQEIILRTPLEHKLQQHMLKPEQKDTSKFLICPMPGTLVSCST